jgi:DNA-binding NtrC family response regulator
MKRDSVSIPRVLLVDDERLVLRSYELILDGLGCVLELAEGPEQALRVMEARPAEVVLADFCMPTMSGEQLLDIVRNRWPKTVRILITGFADVAAVDKLQHQGLFRLLTKPCDAQALRAAISEGLVESHSRLAG